ncbi:MAG: signal peptidase II [bacterium]
MKLKTFFGIFIIVLFFLDQTIKLFVSAQIKPENSGILFGFIEQPKSFLLISNFIILTIIAIFALIYSEKIPFFLLLAGGTSNLIDRIRFGKVIDYFKIGNFSQFNLADLMIYGGIILILIPIITSSISPKKLKQIL